MSKIAWLAGEKGFQKVELVEEGPRHRKVRLSGGEELGLPAAGVPWKGFHPALLVQDEEPKVWRFKGRSLPLVDRGRLPDPAQAEALYRSNAELGADGQPLPYVFQPHTVQVMDGLLAGDHQFLVGHKGTGKTSCLLQVAAYVGAPVVRLNFTGQISISDLMGSLGFGPKGTEWHDGPVITAMRNGYWLLLDEFDFGDPAILSAFHPILERKPYYCLKENDGEVVQAHPGFRVCATGNSIGGDKDGQYVGTQQLNAALLDRFSGHGRIVEIRAMSAKQERAMLKEVMPELPYRLARKASDFAAKVRAEHVKGFSTRELLNFCCKTLECRDAVAAARLTFLPLIESEDVRKGIEAAVGAIFGKRIILGCGQGPARRAIVPGARAPEPAPAKAEGAGRVAGQVSDPAEIEAIWKAYKGNGGAMSYEQIEKDPRFNLRQSNGMNAYRIVKRHAAAMKAKGGA